MSDRIVLDDFYAAMQVAAAAPCDYNEGKDHCVARVKDGKLLGGVIFQGYTGASVELHVAGFHPRWLTRDFLWVAFAYPFIQLNCKKIIGRVVESNRRALEFDLKLGFTEEARVKDVYPDSGDLIILTMRREQCRWLNLSPRERFWEHTDG